MYAGRNVIMDIYPSHRIHILGNGDIYIDMIVKYKSTSLVYEYFRVRFAQDTYPVRSGQDTCSKETNYDKAI